MAPMSDAQWLTLTQDCGLRILDVQSLLSYAIK